MSDSIKLPEIRPEKSSSGPVDLGIVLATLERKCPGIARARADALAHVWKYEIDGIIHEMFRCAEEKTGFSFHIQLKDEVVFELVRLGMHLAEVVIDFKLKNCACDQLDPEVELAEASSPTGQERIRNTGRVYAEGAWIKLTEAWQKQTKRLLEIDGLPRVFKRSEILLPGQGSAKVTTDNHYIPGFTNRPWADVHGKIMVYSRGLDGNVLAISRGYLSWGKASFLYSQDLENQLSAIESDASRPHEKLLSGRPFSGTDERDWITFLTCQYFRTPRFILSIVNRLTHKIVDNEWHFPNFPITPRNLRRAYETLFRNDEVYTSYFRAIFRKAWWVVTPAPGEFFLKPDEPVLLSGNLKDFKGSLVFPLSPTKCFVAGPLFREGRWPLRVGEARLEPGQARRLSLQIAFNARETVISNPSHCSTDLITDLKEVLANHPHNFRRTLESFKPYWGPLRPRG